MAGACNGSGRLKNIAKYNYPLFFWPLHNAAVLTRLGIVIRTIKGIPSSNALDSFSRWIRKPRRSYGSKSLSRLRVPLIESTSSGDGDCFKFCGKYWPCISEEKLM